MIVFSMKAKPHKSIVFPKANFFNKTNVVSNWKRGRFERFRRVSFVLKPSDRNKITR